MNDTFRQPKDDCDKQPHDNWAEYYDFVYEKTFGDHYRILNTSTLDAIKNIMLHGIIVDFGAGTGRLAIPLKLSGFDVIAVEKSVGMVDQLQAKCLSNNVHIPVYNCSISDYSNGDADLALALFTVLSYSLTEQELTDSLKSISQHLRPKGYFFFDLPDPIFFNMGQLINIHSNDFNRSVKLTKIHDIGVYKYHEICSGIFQNRPFSYEAEFCIRYWDLSFVNNILMELGFNDTNRQFPQFGSTGSTYKLFQMK